MKRALICGVGGQDGAYLAKLLLERGYSVFGTSRDAASADFGKLDRLQLRERVALRSMAPTDFRSVHAAIEWAQPDEIYALAGQSSVGLSFEMPSETLESIVLGTLNLLEAVRLSARQARIYHASSSECFGDLGMQPATEQTAFRPCSPYGVAKTSAHMLVASYRHAYDLFAANGILFNHESPLRPERFVTRKITAAAARIADGSDERLRLGRLDIVRDWGWAPEYVEAMWRILQADAPDDFIVATGQSSPLEQFASSAFAAAGLDWRDHVDVDPALGRPADLAWSGGTPAKAAEVLGWQAVTTMAQVAERMVTADRTVL
jgi:GDPmannose 4,6-dehydratase